MRGKLKPLLSVLFLEEIFIKSEDLDFRKSVTFSTFEGTLKDQNLLFLKIEVTLFQ